MVQEKENAFPVRRIQQVGFVIGVLLIAAFAFGFYSWTYRASYVPLYSSLNAEDAANVLVQLDDMRIPYRLSADGNAILVDSRQVDETRIRLDGGSLSIRGGEGFELFDDADFGMTDYVQKINYQRALQGELSRTIIGLTEVRYARVHLVLPEESLFSNNSTEPKASVTLVKEPGMFLTASQISGIQQLIASAVDGLTMGSVTVLDDRGLVLNQQKSGASGDPVPTMDNKQEIEHYLSLKASRILDQLYGPGVALVNIDVSLGRDQVQMTRELWNSPEEPGSGGIIAQSKTQKEFRVATDENGNLGSNELASEVTEVDFRIDKSVEQVVKGEGAIERMTVSVMLPGTTNDEQLLAVRQLIATAIGLQESRGDEIGIFAMPDLAAPSETPNDQLSVPDLIEPPGNILAQADPPQSSVVESALAGFSPRLELMLGALLVAIVFLLGIVMFMRRSPNHSEPSLTTEQRQALLAEVQSWLEGGKVESSASDPSTEGV